MKLGNFLEVRLYLPTAHDRDLFGISWAFWIIVCNRGFHIKRVLSHYQPLFSERHRWGVRKLGAFWLRGIKVQARL